MKKLFIHGGYQRCATTYLQEAIFINLRDFECLGKPTHLFGAGNRNYYYEKRKEFKRDQSIVKLNELQEKAFKRKYLINPVLPRNNFFHVEIYMKKLLEIIKSSEKENFILSDETFFDRLNYFGEENLFFFGEIKKFLEQNLDIEVKIILTIRNQVEILSSIFAFDNFRQKQNFHNFQNFLDNFLNKEKEFYSIFCFDYQYNRLSRMFNSEILVLPLEQLKNDKSTYLKRLGEFLETDITDSSNESNCKKLNFSNKEQTIYSIKSNKYQEFYAFMEKVHNLLSSPIYKKVFEYLRPLKNYFKSKMKTQSKAKLIITVHTNFKYGFSVNRRTFSSKRCCRRFCRKCL